MAKVELPCGIAAIHGKLGNMVFRSRKQPDGKYKVFVYEYRPQPKRLPKVNGRTLDRSWKDVGR